MNTFVFVNDWEIHPNAAKINDYKIFNASYPLRGDAV